MIKFIDSDKYSLDKICSSDVFGTRIYAYFKTYGMEFDFIRFWVQIDDNDNYTAAISLIDGSMTLTCNDAADFEELAIFIRMIGYSSLQCERKVMAEMGFDENIWGYVVRYENTTDREKYKNITLCQNIDYSNVYSLIKSADLLGVGDYLPWLSDVTYRVKKGTAKAAVAVEDGNPAACAMALFITDSAVLLGAVATDKNQRGKGLGGGLVTLLGNEMLSEGKRTELLCKNDSIVDFYRSIGFMVAGEWSISYQEEV